MSKYYDMRIFNLDQDYTIVCNTQNTRYGFRHLASLCEKGYNNIGNTKICYYNRTWERFRYESVLRDLIDKNFKGDEKTKYLKIIESLN